MEHVERNRRRRRLLIVVQVIGFFIIFFFYVLLRIHPELFYHLNPLVFLFDSHFFAGFMDQPGGLVQYASAFLSPLFAHGWLGALVLTLLAALTCLATRRFFTAVTGVGGRVVFLIPAILILMVLGQYIHPVRLCVGLLVALVFASAYGRIAAAPVAVRLAAFLIASAVVYYIAAGLYVVFACLCGLFELGVKRRLALGALYLSCAAALPIAGGAWLFDLSILEAYQGLMLPLQAHWLAPPSSVPTSIAIQTALPLFFPVAAIALMCRRRAGGSPGVDSEARNGNEPPTEAAHVSQRPVSRVPAALAPAVLVVLGVAADVVSFDFPKKCLLGMAHGAEQRRWDDVLACARRLPPSDIQASDPRTIAEVNRALYFRGELLDRMFTYRQVLDSPSLALVCESALIMARLTPRQSSEILFELGRVNESEHMAHEALETFGDRPEILKRLVYIYVLKGEPETARRFLAWLERSLLYGRWARDCRRQLDADPTLSGVPAVASCRELMVTRDSIENIVDLETMLLGLLERNPRNRMAVEYLMAHYLLTRQLDKLAANLHRLDDSDYPQIPRHCEEALVIYLTTTGSRDLDLGGRKISSETWRRFGEFVRTERRFREDPSAAFDALASDFGDSYFFCYVFGHNDLQSGPSRPSK
ncbi:MAG: hypothetical protein HQ582_29885 [Planctomycetes bacterium]|nr:hypothetical protein [Planctomycetota bacterium]